MEFGGLDNPLNSSFLFLSSFCAVAGCIVLLAGASGPGGSAVMTGFTSFKTNNFWVFFFIFLGQITSTRMPDPMFST